MVALKLANSWWTISLEISSTSYEMHQHSKVQKSEGITCGIQTEGQYNLYYIAFNTFLGFFRVTSAADRENPKECSSGVEQISVLSNLQLDAEEFVVVLLAPSSKDLAVHK